MGDPRQELYQPPHHKPVIDKSNRTVAAAAFDPQATHGCFKVKGILTREEKQPEPGENPSKYVTLTGSAAPVHDVTVGIFEEDPLYDDWYGYVSTNDKGYFEHSFCDDDGLFNDTLEIYFRVCAHTFGRNHIVVKPIDLEEDDYCFDSRVIESDGGIVDFDLETYDANSLEAAVFNIADAGFWASKFWTAGLNDTGVFIRWEPGKLFDHSSYARIGNNSVITLGDDPSNPDQWDDSVIIQQWARFAQDRASCNRVPRYSPTVFEKPDNDKRAWVQGFITYYSSAVRTTVPSSASPRYFYDIPRGRWDLEVVKDPSDISAAGVAGLLWDFFDDEVDGTDTVQHGHARIQTTILDPAFARSQACNLRHFLKVWRFLDFPADAETASTVVQNAKISLSSVVAAATLPVSVATVEEIQAAVPQEYRWWDQVTMVVDNSASMAQPPESPKIEAVKDLIQQQVNDLSRNPRGTEFNIYTFNAGSYINHPVLEGAFFDEQINPVLEGLQADGPDTGCPVYGLVALTGAVEDKYDGQVWLYTDGDAIPLSSVDYVQQQLNNQLMRGSIVLLGGCGSPTTLQSDVTGAEKNYLGLAADGSQPGGIVPYLLTAIGTGGQFLHVAPDQLANATDILRAQASHTAGAGRWSDYVSWVSTYRWDKLTSWEYNWITPTDGNDKGTSVEEPLNIAIPPVTVFGETYDMVHMMGDGSIGMGPKPEHTIPPIARYLDVLDRNGTEWYYQLDSDRYIQRNLLDEDDNWVIITTDGLKTFTQSRAYQVWFNKNNGEIRFQYKDVPSDDAANATIGLWEFNDLDEFTDTRLVVSNKVPNGATPGMGYKFTPAPPQPSRDYVVSVDSAISGVGFLLTGYSGSFNPLAITDPDGNAISCDDTENVRCLNLGLVQYVEVNVNQRFGDWQATVSAPFGEQGTFSFSAMATSPIHATALGKRTLSLGEQSFQMDWGLQVEGNQLDGWLQEGNGTPFGNNFTFYDDGAHEDGEAGDGLFGSDGFTPPGQGVAYLWAQATINGDNVIRSDPAPFNFQPLDVQSQSPQVFGFAGSTVDIGYDVTNQDAFAHCYRSEAEVPLGFVYGSFSDEPLCLGPGETRHPYLTLGHEPDLTLNGTAAINMNFYEVEEGRIAGGTTTTVAYVRPLQRLQIDNPLERDYLRPNGSDTVTLTAILLDDEGQMSGWSGNLVEYTLNTTLGSLAEPDGNFDKGQMPIVFTSGNEEGTADIALVWGEAVVATTTLQIRNSFATEIDLVATPTDLREQTTATLVATLRDAWGDPVAGQSVRLSVSDDDGREVNGTIEGSNVFIATTNDQGQVSATFTKGEGEDAMLLATVRAEALVPDGDDFRVTHEDSEMLVFSGDLPEPPPGEPGMFIPMLRKQ